MKSRGSRVENILHLLNCLLYSSTTTSSSAASATVAVNHRCHNCHYRLTSIDIAMEPCKPVIMCMLSYNHTMQIWRHAMKKSSDNSSCNNAIMLSRSYDIMPSCNRTVVNEAASFTVWAVFYPSCLFLFQSVGPFQMRPRISIRGSVRPLVRPSVRPSVTLLSKSRKISILSKLVTVEVYQAQYMHPIISVRQSIGPLVRQSVCHASVNIDKN